MKNVILIVIALVSIIFSGCSTKSNVPGGKVSIEKDGFIISAEVQGNNVDSSEGQKIGTDEDGTIGETE